MKKIQGPSSFSPWIKNPLEIVAHVSQNKKREKKKNIWSEIKLDIFRFFKKKKKNKATIHAHFYTF